MLISIFVIGHFLFIIFVIVLKKFKRFTASSQKDLISRRYDILKLNNVLLHELIHFKLWYLGYDYHDNETQFNETLKKYHVSSSSDKKYNKKLERYEDIINIEYMQKYEEMFQNRTSN